MTIYVSKINGLRLEIAENDNAIIEKIKEYPWWNSTKIEYNIHQSVMKLLKKLTFNNFNHLLKKF